MADELIETRCAMCKRVVCTRMYEGGYGGMGYYNYKNKLTHEERRINVPEQQYAITVIVCQDCIDKEPSLHSIILQRRKEWFAEEIHDSQSKIKHTRKEIEKLKQSIPKMYTDLKDLRLKQKALK